MSMVNFLCHIAFTKAASQRIVSAPFTEDSVSAFHRGSQKRRNVSRGGFIPFLFALLGPPTQQPGCHSNLAVPTYPHLLHPVGLRLVVVFALIGIIPPGLSSPKKGTAMTEVRSVPLLSSKERSDMMDGIEISEHTAHKEVSAWN